MAAEAEAAAATTTESIQEYERRVADEGKKAEKSAADLETLKTALNSLYEQALATQQNIEADSGCNMMNAQETRKAVEAAKLTADGAAYGTVGGSKKSIKQKKNLEKT